MCREGGGEGLIYNVCAVIFVFNTLTNEEGGLKDLQLLTLSDSPPPSIVHTLYLLNLQVQPPSLTFELQPMTKHHLYYYVSITMYMYIVKM